MNVKTAIVCAEVVTACHALLLHKQDWYTRATLCSPGSKNNEVQQFAINTAICPQHSILLAEAGLSTG